MCAYHVKCCTHQLLGWRQDVQDGCCAKGNLQDQHKVYMLLTHEVPSQAWKLQTCGLAPISALYVTVASRGGYGPDALGVKKYSTRTVAPGESLLHDLEATPPLSSKSERGHWAPFRTMSVAALQCSTDQAETSPCAGLHWGCALVWGVHNG